VHLNPDQLSDLVAILLRENKKCMESVRSLEDMNLVLIEREKGLKELNRQKDEKITSLERQLEAAVRGRRSISDDPQN
jgi:hypothetical protein